MTTPLTTAAPASRRRAAPLPPEERRASIIEAVLPLLMEQGAAVTSRQLAAAAGVSEGTIFNAFGDKEALLAAVLAAAVDTAPFERAIAAIGSELPFEERLAEAVVLIQRRIADIWRLVTQLGPHHHTHPPRPLPDSPALAELLVSAPGRLRVEPADGARLLRSITFACTHPMLTSTPRPPADVVALFLHGAAQLPAAHVAAGDGATSHRGDAVAPQKGSR